MSTISHSLRPHHTFSMPVQAANLVTVYDLNELRLAYRAAQERQHPVLFLGGGSNVLFCEDFAGTVIVIRLNELQIEEQPDAWHLQVGAGYQWHQLVCHTLKQRIPGLENLAMIPGCVGAAAIQNIGAYGVEFKHFCSYVDLFDLEKNQIIRLPAEACRLAYRDSLFKYRYRNGFAIIAVGLKIAKQWRPTLTYGELTQLDPSITPEALFEKICAIRRDKLPDPKTIGNAGSFFKNPIINTTQLKDLLTHYPDLPFHLCSEQQVKVSAGWLIERAGLKGYSVGNAAVCQNHSLVLVNLGQATSLEMITLARTVRRQVNRCFNILLEPEVCLIGADGVLESSKVLL